MPVLSAPVSSAGALEPGAATETVVAISQLGAPGEVLTIAALRALPGWPVAGIDVGRAEPGQRRLRARGQLRRRGRQRDNGRAQHAGRRWARRRDSAAQNQLSATYTLTQVGIRRRARFGPGCRRLDRPAGTGRQRDRPPRRPVERPRPERHLRVGAWRSAGTPTWSATTRSIRAGCWSTPTRRTPSSPANPATEEGLLATDPAFPCCCRQAQLGRARLDFVGRPLGVRAPVVQRFTDSTSTLRWLLPAAAGRRRRNRAAGRRPKSHGC